MHTLGPWEVRDLVENDNDPRHVEIVKGKNLIAKAYYGETDEECACNAHMIAAAPITTNLLTAAMIELDSYYREIGGEERKRDGLHVDGVPLVELIRNHLKSI
jgi:hypothetical protein